jgi:cytochrome c
MVRLSVRYSPQSIAFAALLMILVAATLPHPATAQQERPAAFRVCAGCHSTQVGKTVFGPSLAGIGGRRAGTLEGYAYSPALKSSGLTWNAKTLDRWLTAPKKMVPGTKMPFNGIQDRATRDQVIAYLLKL